MSIPDWYGLGVTVWIFLCFGCENVRSDFSKRFMPYMKHLDQVNLQETMQWMAEGMGSLCVTLMFRAMHVGGGY